MNEDTPKRAVLFLRVNQRALDSKQAVKHAIEVQRAKCKQLADQLGAAIVGEYTDLGGAVELGRRNVLLDMLGDLMIHRSADYVITQDWARLSSKAEDLLLVRQTVADAGARVMASTDQAARPLVDVPTSRTVGDGARTGHPLKPVRELLRQALALLNEVVGSDRSDAAKRGWDKRRARAKEVTSHGTA